MGQRGFASAEYAMQKKLTRREKFLAEVERIVPWPSGTSRTASAYSKTGANVGFEAMNRRRRVSLKGR